MGLVSNTSRDRAIGEIKVDSSMVFAINGVRVKSPNSIQCISSDFSYGHTNYTGEWVGYNIRRRRKVYWIYTAAKKEDVFKIYNMIEEQYISDRGNMFFEITTPFVGKNSVTMTMYKGDTTTYEPVQYTGKDGITRWKYQLNWIEKSGILFATPGAIPT